VWGREVWRDGRVVLGEAAACVRGKVRSSGGGGCNTPRACFEGGVVVKRFPRGARGLVVEMNRFGPR